MTPGKNGKTSKKAPANRGRELFGGFMAAGRFDEMRAAYRRKWGAALAAVDPEGRLVRGRLPAGCATGETERLLATLIQESIRWGDPPFDLLPDGGMVWVAPLLCNMRLVGGIAAFAPPSTEGGAAVKAREAAHDLRRTLEEENLTNAALLSARREQYLSERRRAEAIHAYKTRSPDFRSIYIREEPALMAAIRKGDREEARRLLNNILVVLHHQAGDNLPLVKSLFLEMVTLMCRSAVETGCDARELLGRNYETFTALSAIESDDGLGPWLHDTLERLMDAIHRHRNDSPAALLQAAMAFMHENLHRDISRDQAAAVAHLSPAHFSRIFKKELRESFTDMLNRMRIDQATELLARTDRGLCMVALDCGFKDQSYFTKVFRKYMRETPREYRLRLRADRNAGEGRGFR